MDRYLDTARAGPLWLGQPNVADLVSAHIRRGAEERMYELDAWVVMANHVHLLLRPLIKSSEALRRIKGRSAREANLILGRTAAPFWQAESYDHWVRNDEEMSRITRYIENNPVTAGSTTQAEDYRWSSAWPGGASLGLQRRRQPSRRTETSHGC
jgi:REP-associated tyrosine transposase